MRHPQTLGHYLGAAALAVLGCVSTPLAAAPFAYVPDADKNVSVVDLATRRVVSVIALGVPVHSIAINPAGTQVFVAHATGQADPGWLTLIDTATNMPVATFPGGGSPGGIKVGASGTRLYVAAANPIDNTVSIFDTTTLNRIAAIFPSQRYLWDIVVTPDESRAYVSNQRFGFLDVLDLTAGQAVGTASYGQNVAHSLAMGASGRLYVGTDIPSELVYDDSTGRARIPLTTSSGYVAVNPAETRAYVAGRAATGDAVCVVDLGTKTVIATIAVTSAGNLSGLAVDPAGTFVYAIDSGGDRVVVIDANTNTIVDTIPTGRGPAVMGNFVGPATIVLPPPPAPVGGTNWALAANGGTASASSTYSDGFPASGAIDGDRAGRNWGSGSSWNDGTPMEFPDWLQVRFMGMKTIDRVTVYTVQDHAFTPMEPTDAMTFSDHGVQDFTVEGWTGTSWVLLGRVEGNSLVKRTLTFPPVAVDRIFINVTRTADGYTNITEVEAWSSEVPVNSDVNVALASQGSLAFASSEYNAAFPATAVINGDRAGRNWGAGSGWNDGTVNAWPDWLQVVFGQMRTINHIVVYTLQDDAMNPVEPDDTMQFTNYGIQDFTLEGWTGTNWVPLGRVINNRTVKRTVTFAPVTVDRIFINVTRSLGGYSHITELEAYGH